jgi:predicted PurR-regulated permease PerM
MMKHSFSSIQQTVFFSAVIAGCLFFGSIVLPFFMPFFWAVVMSILLYPLYLKIVHWYNGRESLAALTAILGLIIGIVLPVVLIATMLTQEAVSVYEYVHTNPEQVDLKIQQGVSMLNAWGIDTSEFPERIRSYSASITTWIAQEALTLGKATGLTLIKTILALYIVFYLLRDGRKLLKFIQYILPLGNRREVHLFNTFSSITRALIKGTVLTALLQGAVGGILLWVGGAPSVLLLTALMTILACIPGVGPTLVWLPAGIFEIATGNMLGGLIILIGGFGVISMIDNVVRPILVGRDTALPDSVILISILGGLVTFGIPGLIIGPVSAGLALALLEMFASEYNQELEEN